MSRPSLVIQPNERAHRLDQTDLLPIADELIAVATGLSDAHPGQTVVIVVGSSSHVSHRVVGSVTVSLARHSPVPVLIVP